MVIPSVAEDLRPLHILVVDDDPLLRTFLAEGLRDAGMTVIEASNANEALTYCQSDAPVDLVFTDVQMPGSLDGIGLARRLSKTEPSIPVIVTSGAVPGDSLDPEIPFIGKPYAVKDAKTLIFSTLGLEPQDTE
ncbi:MAG: response regulator [Sphingobium sp.]